MPGIALIDRTGRDDSGVARDALDLLGAIQ
jgi:hypothetical protein